MLYLCRRNIHMRSDMTLEKIYNIIEPRIGNRISRVYDVVMLLAIAMGIFPLMFRTQHKIFIYFDIISCICYVVDYILRWITAGVRTGKKGWKVYLFYPFTPMAIIDLLSILPTINLLTPTFKIARVSRLLKILRLIKVIRYYEPLGIILTVIKKQKQFLFTVLSLAIFYIFITALIMFNVEAPVNPATGEELFNDFFDAFYWAACTLTTVGYGDIYPISDTGRVISIISSIVGIAVIALPSGIFTAGYINELKLRNGETKSDETDIENSGKDYHRNRFF